MGCPVSTRVAGVDALDCIPLEPTSLHVPPDPGSPPAHPRVPLLPLALVNISPPLRASRALVLPRSGEQAPTGDEAGCSRCQCALKKERIARMRSPLWWRTELQDLLAAVLVRPSAPRLFPGHLPGLALRGGPRYCAVFHCFPIFPCVPGSRIFY